MTQRFIITNELLAAMRCLQPEVAVELFYKLINSACGMAGQASPNSVVNILAEDLSDTVQVFACVDEELSEKRRQAGRLGGLAKAAKMSSASSFPQDSAPVQPPETEVISNLESDNGDPNSQAELARTRVAGSLWGDYRGVIGVQGEEGGQGGSLSPNPGNSLAKPKIANSFNPLKPTLPAEIDTPEVREAWAAWADMRKRIKKPLTQRAVTRAVNKLTELSHKDPATAVGVLDQSTYCCWQDLYALKDNHNYGSARVTTMPAKPAEQYIPPKAIEL